MIRNRRVQYSCWKYGLISAAAILLAVLGIAFYTTNSLVNPERRPIEVAPQLVFEEVTFSPRNSSLELSGWLLPATGNNRYLIFAHGYGGNRADKLDVAEDLAREGYGVLLFDFRNSGRSEGDITSIGLYEKEDLLGAIRYLQEFAGKELVIGLIGYSMGAAVSALAAAEAPEVGAVVMDSSFADLYPYIQKNLPVWSGLPAFPFNWLILNLGTRFWNIDPRAVRPVKAVQKNEAPILFIHGEDDLEIPADNSQKLKLASNNPRDELWLVPKAGHVQASEHPGYRDKITEFLDSHLGK